MRGFRVLLALSLALIAGPALAQVNPGTSPLSGAKGGTGNGFMQFTGPATSLKTFTLPNANSTLATTPVPNSALATMPAYTSKCNNTGGTAVPTDCDATAFTLKASPVSGDLVVIQDSAASFAFKKTTAGALASVGSVASVNGATGAITVNGANGVVLTTAGAANVANVEQYSFGPRVTVVNGICVTKTDQLAQTFVYLSPCGGGNKLPIYDGTNMELHQFTSNNTDQVGLTTTLGSNWAANTNYDEFVTLVAGVVTKCDVAWSNSGAGTSARATAINWNFKGAAVNDAAISSNCRVDNSTLISVAQYQGTLVGGFRTNGSAGQVDLKFGTAASGGGAACICIWSVYNPQVAAVFVGDTTTTWNYTSTTLQQANASTGNQINILQGMATPPIDITTSAFSSNSGGNSQYVGVGIDSASVNSALPRIPNSTTSFLESHARYIGSLAIGYHNVTRLEGGVAAGTTTWIGNSAVSQTQSGILGTVPY
jgi:hypothetical protein